MTEENPYISHMIDICINRGEAREKIRHLASRGFPVEGKKAQIAYQTFSLGNESDNSEWQVVEFGESGEYVIEFTRLYRDLFAGTSLGNIYKSTDYGDTWEIVSSGILDKCLILRASPLTDIVYASSGTKAIRSLDEGQTWQEIEVDFDK